MTLTQLLLSIGLAVGLVHPSMAQTVSRISAARDTRSQASMTSAVMAPPSRTPSLDSLVTLALAVNPNIRAAAAYRDAAQARIGPVGTRPDPTLMVGVLDFPYQRPGYSDNFTMNMVRVTQTVPYPGKLSLAKHAAQDDAAASQAVLAQTTLDVARDVKVAYYELAFVQRARDIVQHNAELLKSLARVTEVQYSVGTSAQTDVLRARVEIARLGNEAAALAAEERATLATLNAVLDRPSDTPAGTAVIPESIARLAGADSGAHTHFSSTALGAAAADSPLLPLDSLDALAITHSPTLRAYTARVSAQEHRLELAQKAHLPDFDISFEYDQRPQFSNYISVYVSVPLRLQQRRKQAQEVAGADADLRALQGEHAAEVNSIRREVATRVSDVERERTQLALSLSAILPQARATLASATASYQVGHVDFTSLIDAQATVFNSETAYWRSLTNFAKALAELQRTVGAEVLR